MNHSTATPPTAPTVLLKAKTAYTQWLFLYKRFPKPERFGVGEKMDILFLEVLELLSELRFAPSAKKLVILEQSLSQIDRLKFFAEITWENKLIKVNQFSELIKNLSEIGRELGGWKKGLNKTPPK